MDRISQVTLRRNKGGDCVTSPIAGKGRKLRALELISFLCAAFIFCARGEDFFPESFTAGMRSLVVDCLWFIICHVLSGDLVIR